MYHFRSVLVFPIGCTLEFTDGGGGCGNFLWIERVERGRKRKIAMREKSVCVCVFVCEGGRRRHTWSEKMVADGGSGDERAREI